MALSYRRKFWISKKTCNTLWKATLYASSLYLIVHFVQNCLLIQEEDFEEDEGIYDELNLEEEEEKFGLIADDDDSSSPDEASEGGFTVHMSQKQLNVSQRNHYGPQTKNKTRKACQASSVTIAQFSRRRMLRCSFGVSSSNTN